MYNPVYSEFVQQEKMASLIKPEELARKIAESSMASTAASINASMVVFLHTFLDEFLYDLFELLSIAKPEYWDDLIKDKKVQFAELVEANVGGIRTTLIKNKLNEIEGKSMIEKMDVLHQICAPRVKTDNIRDYIYDRTKLVAFNNLRHDIVHGRQAINTCRELIEEEINYLEKIGAYFMAMVFLTCEVRANMTYAEEILTKK